MAKFKENPASAASTLPNNFRPMSAGQLRLQVPEREGYHRHWFRNEPGRIERAKQAGYTFVRPEDVSVNNFDLGGDSSVSGSSDMGEMVSVVSGDLDSKGEAGRLYLMECPIEYFEASQAEVTKRNDQIAESIRGGMLGAGANGETGVDAGNRYLKGAIPDLFNPNKRRP